MGSHRPLPLLRLWTGILLAVLLRTLIKFCLTFRTGDRYGTSPLWHTQALLAVWTVIIFMSLTILKFTLLRSPCILNRINFTHKFCIFLCPLIRIFTKNAKPAPHDQQQCHISDIWNAESGTHNGDYKIQNQYRKRQLIHSCSSTHKILKPFHISKLPSIVTYYITFPFRFPACRNFTTISHKKPMFVWIPVYLCLSV